MKLCNGCLQEKDPTEFYKQGTRLTTRCKVCIRTANSAWAKRNNTQKQLFQKYRRRDRKQQVVELLGGKCNRCGVIDHPAIYDVHHLKEKEYNLSKILEGSWEKILNELNKGVLLLCANCHRKEHINAD